MACSHHWHSLVETPDPPPFQRIPQICCLCGDKRTDLNLVPIFVEMFCEDGLIRERECRSS